MPSKAHAPEAWRLRRAGPRDLASLVALEVACFEPERRYSRRVLLHSLRGASMVVWLLVRGSDDPGDAGGVLVLRLFPRAVHMFNVAVHPEFQGKGLGRRLLDQAEAVARKRGAERITLEADPKTPGLVAMYERRGFLATERLPGYYAPGRDAVRMVKVLG